MKAIDSRNICQPNIDYVGEEKLQEPLDYWATALGYWASGLLCLLCPQLFSNVIPCDH